MFHADGQTERHDETNSRSSQFCERKYIIQCLDALFSYLSPSHITRNIKAPYDTLLAEFTLLICMLHHKCCVQNRMSQYLLLRQVSKASLHSWESSSFNQTIELTYKFTTSSFSLPLNLSARYKNGIYVCIYVCMYVFIFKCIY